MRPSFTRPSLADFARPPLAGALLATTVAAAALAVTVARRRKKTPKQIVRRYFEAWQKGDDEVIDELLADDYTGHVHTLAGVEERDPGQVHDLVRSHSDAFEWTEYEVDDVFEDGDRAAARVSVRAGHAETGREGEMSGLVIFRFDDGCIAEEWSSWDYLGLAEQLGLSGNSSN